MFIIDLIVAFIVAIIFGVILAAVIGWERPGRTGFWPAMLFVFLIIFFTAWAGGIWLIPMGPPIGGSYWLAFVVVGLLVALILAAVVPNRRGKSTVRFVEEEEVREAEAVLGGFFWLLILALVVAVLIRYIG